MRCIRAPPKQLLAETLLDKILTIEGMELKEGDDRDWPIEERKLSSKIVKIPPYRKSNIQYFTIRKYLSLKDGTVHIPNEYLQEGIRFLPSTAYSVIEGVRERGYMKLKLEHEDGECFKSCELHMSSIIKDELIPDIKNRGIELFDEGYTVADEFIDFVWGCSIKTSQINILIPLLTKYTIGKVKKNIHQ